MTTSKAFFESWRTACDAQVKQLWDDWDEAALFTNHILHKSDSVLAGVSKSLSLASYGEYYAVDAVLYDQEKDLIPRCPAG